MDLVTTGLPAAGAVLGALFNRLFLTRLLELHDAGRPAFFDKMAGLSVRCAFQRHLAPARKKRWVVYAKSPFAGSDAVLAYLSAIPIRSPSLTAAFYSSTPARSPSATRIIAAVAATSSRS